MWATKYGLRISLLASHIHTHTLSPSHVLPAAAASSPVRWRCFVPAAPCCPSAPQSFSHSPVAERWGRPPAARLYLSLLSEQQAEEQESQEGGNEEWGAWKERNGGGRREKGEGRWNFYPTCVPAHVPVWVASLAVSNGPGSEPAPPLQLPRRLPHSGSLPKWWARELLIHSLLIVKI